MSTSSMSRPASSAPERAEEMAREWMAPLARAGYAAKGVVYITLGFLSAGAAMGWFGSTSGTRDAVMTLGQTTPGNVVIAVLALGLLSYVLWRGIQVIFDPDDHGTDASGLLQRGFLLVSGIAYTMLLLATVDMLLGTGGGSGSSRESWAAATLRAPLGRWLLVAFGTGVFGRGIAEGWKAFTGSFEDKLRSGISDPVKRWGVRAGRFGLAARGISFLVIGGFVIHAGLTYDPSEVRGLEGALDALGGVPNGRWVVAAVSAGLASYGVYQLFKAGFRRIPDGA